MTDEIKKRKEKPERKKDDPLERVIAKWDKENVRLQVFNQVLKEQAYKKVN
jgi:hypothetical protein